MGQIAAAVHLCCWGTGGRHLSSSDELLAGAQRFSLREHVRALQRSLEGMDRLPDVLNLENIVKDPRYLNATFVLIHGGYPYFREVIWLASMKKVYIDTSEIETLVYPSELKNVLKLWLETYPEKITFGSDSYPFSTALGSEEMYWLPVYSARDALAAALAEMVASNEVTEDKALEIARGYLHDNAISLYPSAPR